MNLKTYFLALFLCFMNLEGRGESIHESLFREATQIYTQGDFE